MGKSVSEWNGTEFLLPNTYIGNYVVGKLLEVY